MLSHMTPEIAQKAHALTETVDETIPKHQTAAENSLELGHMWNAYGLEMRAVETFAEAEGIFDELLTLVEQEGAKQPPPDAPCPAPTLEQILAMLENEMQACEKLGAACRKPNVQTNFEWLFSCSGGGGGGGGGSSSGGSGGGGGSQGQQPVPGPADDARQVVEQLERLRDSLQATARMLANDHELRSPPIELGEDDGAADGRDWNTLASELADELKQGHDNVPPEEYRQAIDSYFRALSGAISGAAP